MEVERPTDVGIHVALTNLDAEEVLSPSAELVDVTRDGNCLYYCIMQLADLTSHSLKNGIVTTFRDQSQLRDVLVARLLDPRYKSTYAQRWKDDMKYELRGARNVSGTTFENLENMKSTLDNMSEDELLKWYAYYMTNGVGTDAWGGDIQMDLAAEYFGVTIRKYETGRKQDTSDILLTATFFPDERTLDMAAKREYDPRTTQWEIVLVPGHFNYVMPFVTQAQPVASSPKPQEANVDMTAVERGEMLRRIREQRTVRGDNKKVAMPNAELGKLVLESRNRRGETCAAEPIYMNDELARAFEREENWWDSRIKPSKETAKPVVRQQSSFDDKEVQAAMAESMATAKREEEERRRNEEGTSRALPSPSQPPSPARTQRPTARPSSGAFELQAQRQQQQQQQMSPKSAREADDLQKALAASKQTEEQERRNRLRSEPSANPARPASSPPPRASTWSRGRSPSPLRTEKESLQRVLKESLKTVQQDEQFRREQAFAIEESKRNVQSPKSSRSPSPSSSPPPPPLSRQGSSSSSSEGDSEEDLNARVARLRREQPDLYGKDSDSDED